MSVIGFDLGNETCQIAVARAGGIEVLDNEYSLRITPSYVGFNKNSRTIGLAARNKIISNIGSTIFNFKNILGKEFAEESTQIELSYLPYDAIELHSGQVGVQVKYLNEQVELAVQQITAIILIKLKAIAESKTGIKMQDCVISVPIYYTDMQRRALIDSCSIAGLNVSQLMNESTAAALLYGFYKRNMFHEKPKMVVFIDLGHSALTVTACKFYEEKLSILGSLWNMRVGGREFDSILVKYFANDFKERYGIDVLTNRKALMTLFLECEVLKKQMSANSRELEMNIECLMKDIDVEGKMKRDLFEKLSASLLSDIEKTMRDLIEECHIELQDIDAVQIIGGSSRIPALRSLIVKVFGKEPQTTLNQDEAVARGCSLQCALLSPTLMTKPYEIEDIQPFAVKVVYKTENNIEEIPVFDRFHKIPSTRVITFPYKGIFTLEIQYEKEAKKFAEMGKFCFSDTPEDFQKISDVKVKIKVTLDENGVINIVSAKLVAKYVESVEKTESDSQNMMVALPENQAELSENMTPDPTTKIEDVEKKDVQKEIVKCHELSIISFLPQLDSNAVSNYKEQERKMREKDIKSQKIADLRNDIEEYLFFIRDKLNNDLANFVHEDDKINISQCVNETEDWLYDTDDLEDETEFYRRQMELKRQFEPKMNKYLKAQEVKNALKEFQTFLELIAKDEAFAVKDNVTEPQQYQEMKESLNRANDYIRYNLDEIDRMKSSDEFKLSTLTIREEMNSIRNALQQLHKCDSEPKIAAVVKDTATKDGSNLKEQETVGANGDVKIDNSAVF